MARYCVDANAVLHWLFHAGFPLVDQFWAERTLDDEFISAPPLMGECTSVIRENVFYRRIRPEHGRELVGQLIEMDIEVNLSLEQFPRALDLAERFQRLKAYDMQYLAVAEIEGGELVTADRGMRYAAEAIGVPVRFLL